MQKRCIQIDDLYRLKAVNEPRFSSDGRFVLFSVQSIEREANLYRSHLWIVEVETARMRQLTFGAVHDSAASWSPDGRQIVFLRSFEGDTQLWIMPADSLEARPLTRLEEGLVGGPIWSPAGDRVTFTFRPTHPDWTRAAQKVRAVRGLSEPPRVHTRRRYRIDGIGFIDQFQHILVCDVVSGQTRLLINGEFDANFPIWSPDGKWMAFLANRCPSPDHEPYRANLWLAPVDGGEPVEVKLFFGYKRNLSWSPDGKHIAFIGYETTEDSWGPPQDRVWVIPAIPPGAGKARCLTGSLDRFTGQAIIADMGQLDESSQSPTWWTDSKSLVFPVSDMGSTHIYRVGLECGQEPELVVGGDRNVMAFSLDTQNQALALLISDSTKPAEIYYVIQPFGDTLKPLTDMNAGLLDEVVFSDPSPIWIKSPDGQQVQGWVLCAPDFVADKSYPMLLDIHGGPDGQYGHTFFHEFQALAARGVVVVYCNPRGSLGAGAEFARAIKGAWGGLDCQDLMAVVDHVAGLPFIDPERMAVAGGSYGGFMAAWIICHSDRFRCAIADRGSFNKQSGAGTSDWPPMPDGYWPG
ncbi:MAG: S9 family peptidase, partial [Anaerolineales bacterium]|nr:S9 family peptidase [Anaerolineales bacterium]